MEDQPMMKRLAAGFAAIALCLAVGLPAFAQLNAITRSGLDLTAQDWELMEAAASKLYLTEETPVGAVETWSNQESGNGGSIELIQTGEYQGMPCRRLQHDIKVKNVADPYRFTVDRCKTAEGTWKVL
jgi:surface antigen